MRYIAIGLVVVSAVLIVYGRVRRKNLVAGAGYALLALAALVYLVTR